MLAFNELQLVKGLSAMLNTACLLPDNTLDAYIYLEVSASGEVKKVRLNNEDLEKDIYTITT